MQAGSGGAGGGSGEGEASERGHDEGVRGFGFGGFAEEHADARAIDPGGVGERGLGDDDTGIAGSGYVSDCAEFETEAADVDGGGALGLADEIGDGDLLRAEAFGDADGPLAANGAAGGRVLREDFSGRCVWGVETVFEGEAEAEGAGLFAGFGECEAGERGDLDLAAMDGETHGDEGGEERDDEHREGSEDDVEEAIDAADPNFQLHTGSGYREGLPGVDRRVRVTVAGRLDLVRTIRGLDAAMDAA